MDLEKSRAELDTIAEQPPLRSSPAVQMMLVLHGLQDAASQQIGHDVITGLGQVNPVRPKEWALRFHTIECRRGIAQCCAVVARRRGLLPGSSSPLQPWR